MLGATFSCTLIAGMVAMRGRQIHDGLPYGVCFLFVIHGRAPFLMFYSRVRGCACTRNGLKLQSVEVFRSVAWNPRRCQAPVKRWRRPHARERNWSVIVNAQARLELPGSLFRGKKG